MHAHEKFSAQVCNQFYLANPLLLRRKDATCSGGGLYAVLISVRTIAHLAGTKSSCVNVHRPSHMNTIGLHFWKCTGVKFLNLHAQTKELSKLTVSQADLLALAHVPALKI